MLPGNISGPACKGAHFESNVTENPNNEFSNANRYDHEYEIHGSKKNHGNVGKIMFPAFSPASFAHPFRAEPARWANADHQQFRSNRHFRHQLEHQRNNTHGYRNRKHQGLGH
jgi:hypothetical protein